MKGIITTLALFCLIFAGFNTSHSQNFSGTIQTFSNHPAMFNKAPDSKFAINSNFNESKEKGSYNVYYSYFSNFGKINKGTYNIRILKHIGNRMKEMFYTIEIKNETPSFHDILVLKKGVYSIRIYDENKVLLGHSGYFSVTDSQLLPEYAKK